MQKPTYEALQSPERLSFLIRTFAREAFRAPYHFHPELELTLITSGEGKRFVGNHMGGFFAGDLVLLGPHLAHCWKTVDMDPMDPVASAIVIQFSPRFLGNDFFSKPEMTRIRQLFGRADGGLRFTGEARDLAEAKIRRLAGEESNFSKLLALLELLQHLATTRSFQVLDPHPLSKACLTEERQRINDVWGYVIDHFRGAVSLEAAARVAGLSPNAFCKYFKRITRRTFMETVIEYRLNYAAEQLVSTDLPVSTVCFDSGFGDISHFNKTFKAKTGLSPLNYRKQFDRELHSPGREAFPHGA